MTSTGTLWRETVLSCADHWGRCRRAPCAVRSFGGSRC